MSRTIAVTLPPSPAGSYDIRIEPGLLDRLGALTADLAKAPAAAVVTDANVERLYARRAGEQLSAAGFRVGTVSFAPGEQNKTLESVALVYAGLSKLPFERAMPVIALGGGVVGDLAGFAAATFLRGLPVIQVPTTLLACVDSSVGGKTGVDFPAAGKNTVGAFHQPRLVLIDPLLLATLPPAEWACGLAETVKHGLIRDAGFFDWIEARADALAVVAADAAAAVPRSADLLCELIERNCRIKAAVVIADERESGLRAILNFGHTVGHAIEALAGYGRLRHGEAVSIGMMVAARIAEARGLFDGQTTRRLAGLLERLRLPVRVPAEFSSDDILAMARKDKKVRAAKVRFVLPTAVGAVTIVDDVTDAEAAAAVERSR